jgi:hypothetical protein
MFHSQFPGLYVLLILLDKKMQTQKYLNGSIKGQTRVHWRKEAHVCDLSWCNKKVRVGKIALWSHTACSWYRSIPFVFSCMWQIWIVYLLGLGSNKILHDIALLARTNTVIKTSTGIYHTLIHLTLIYLKKHQHFSFVAPEWCALIDPKGSQRQIGIDTSLERYRIYMTTENMYFYSWSYIIFYKHDIYILLMLLKKYSRIICPRRQMGNGFSIQTA